MQHIENNNGISSTEYFNEAKRICESQNTAIKYIGLALYKISIVIHSNLYVPDTPEDSYIKRGARYIGKTFFNVVEVIDTNSYFTLGATTLVLSAGMFANKLGAINTGNHQYTSFLTHFGRASFATIIFCDFFNKINHMKNMLISRLKHTIMYRKRYNEIIAYDELTLYDGDPINAETLLVISQVELKDAQQPVICDKQLYEHKNLVTWHLISYQNTGTTCPHNRNKLIWSSIQRVEK